MIFDMEGVCWCYMNLILGKTLAVSITSSMGISMLVLLLIFFYFLFGYLVFWSKCDFLSIIVVIL